ncbi:MAG: hypothetical protein NTU73_02745 [Ignavibacteriae bacterium]|nr:hypothetical protein [Ignavibacteriota bacterium]
MKFIKIFLVFTFAVAFYSCEFNNNPSSSNSVIVNRKVLVELSTNVNCANCPTSDNFLSLIDTAIAGVTSCDTNVITMRIHSSIFLNDPFHSFNKPINLARETYYGIYSNPWGLLNGSRMPAFNSQTWANSINLTLAQNETQNLTFTNTFDTTARTGTLNISISQISGSPAGDLKLHVAIIESKLYYGGGSNKEVWFNNVLRDLITGAAGQDIALPFNSPINYTLINGINPANADIIIFTQSLSSKEVFVVRKMKLVGS